MEKAEKIRIIVGVLLILLFVGGAVLVTEIALGRDMPDSGVTLTEPNAGMNADENIKLSLRITPVWRKDVPFDDTMSEEIAVKGIPAEAVYHKKQDGAPEKVSGQFLPQPPAPTSYSVSAPFTGTKEAFTSAATVKSFLKSALEPVGECLYVYGGAWNEPDTGAGIEALSYGPSPEWKKFFDQNDATYNYENYLYRIHLGLDCTGYLGYSAYQVFGPSFSSDGYVFTSGTVGAGFQKLFGGTVTMAGAIKDYRAGDIMYKKGHAYIVIGRCGDGSLVFLHASPPDVTICGTYSSSGDPDSEAVGIAHEYMERIAPVAHSRYENCSRNTSYLTDYNQYRFPGEAMDDPDGYCLMTPRQILDDLLG